MGGKNPQGGHLTEALRHPTLKDNDKTSSRKASVAPLGIFPSHPDIFVTIQYLAIKVNAGALALGREFAPALTITYNG
jgi:hypothetical protein